MFHASLNVGGEVGGFMPPSQSDPSEYKYKSKLWYDHFIVYVIFFSQQKIKPSPINYKTSVLY